MNDPYLYPYTDILKNLADIRDREMLLCMEAEYTSIRLAELVIGESASRFDFASLCDMHHYIFQDIYEWAGKIRIINIEKPEPALGGISIEYSDCFDIEKDTTFVLNKMNQYVWEKALLEEVAKMFSQYLAELWKVHPYREGNTRTVITFQLMLNNTDCRVIQFKNGCNSDGQPARDFYNSKDLNDYFSDLDEQTMRKFFSIEFNKIIDITNDLFSEYYAQNSGSSVKGALSLLNKLRNSEMHFFIDKDTFLLEKEFQQLHNFMIVFYDILHFYSLLPFWGRFEKWEYTKLQFDRKTLSDFTYKNAVRNTKFVRNLKEQLENEIFPASLGGSAFNFADSIACVLNEYQGNRFEDLWIYFDMFDESERELLRKCIIFYASISADRINKTFVTSAIDGLEFSKIRRDLFPVIRKKDNFNLDERKEEAKRFIKELMVLTGEEKECQV